ncbi:GDSL-type esterase/lipase family protein [Mucilaginibacter sabulilitoris]|uniref:GDSL-type esterase/lipase family protein n=1 Tax=Mucilaginibacter sabulilitoris TaxID=1173583 RepID=A0ABZ0TJT3_9SPHI|nr:GDSL-type esterase/lipase family protein [Mucilaginibacter sabulilitoris]WPU93407.1 GDSL-type esterase/lipase family protein [Mucilaginibacter sabulilitoris]
MKLKLLLIFIGCAFAAHVFAQQGFPFENEIKAFKHQDSLNFPKPNGILFIGSSSIRLWSDLEQRFPDKPIIKRGVGGCLLQQVVEYYTPYILFPYHPRKIFIYAGDNDISAGRSAVYVSNEFGKLWTMIHEQLPQAEIYFLSIKPSPVRAKYYGTVAKANELIKAWMQNKPQSHFVDLVTVTNKPGTSLPDSSLFKKDYLHLNPKGYDKWQSVLQPLVN